MTDATESHPALGILGQIRTLSSDLTAQERSRFCEVLAAAQTDLDTLSPDPTVGNVRLVLDWVQLHAGKNSLRTLHNFLDDAAQFLAFIGARPIIETLQTSARETLYPVDKPVDSLGRYFWTLRSLYWLATRTERECDLPPALRYHHRGKLRARYVLTQSDLQNLIRALGDEGALPVTFPASQRPLWLALILLCHLAGLRIREALALSLGSVWITDRLTVMALGKGDKRRTVERSPDTGETPAWMLDFLRAVWRRRFREVDGHLAAPLLALTDTRGHPIGYKQVRQVLTNLGFDHGTHIFRRGLANTLMANGTPALTVINLLGHATTGTAPKSYIQVYPCLQCEQLSAWLESQVVIQLRPSLSLADFGAAQGISREGAYKLARECLEARRDLRRSSSLALADLVSILRYRIRKAQNQQLTSVHLPGAERPGVPVD